MHTLSIHGIDIACAQRWQRLSMHMAEWPRRAQERHMRIRSGHPRYPVRELR